MTEKRVDLKPRQAALAWVGKVLSGQAMPGQEPYLKDKTPSALAEAKRLSEAILRHRPNLDRLLQPFLQKSPPTQIRHVLYLVLVETQLFDTVPYAAVSAAVEIAKRDPGTKGKFSALVNAIARQIVDLPKGVLLAEKPPKLPKPIRGPLIAAHGQPVVEKLEVAHRNVPQVDLCYKPGRLPVTADGTSLAPNHLRLPPKSQITKLDGFEAGDFWVQDFAAQQPISALGDVSGLNVLDLCAAPGGKTMQLAAAGATVTAVDISEDRLERLHQNLHRTGLTAEVITADILNWSPTEKFDGVVLDAPCSATGTIRRHPDLPYIKSDSSIKDLARLQRNLITQSASWVKPDGRFLFVTCSLLPVEGERQADWIEEQFPKFTPETLILPQVIPEQASQHRCRLRPDMLENQGGMDGFFFALYRLETG
ncbi:MAG: methyltransferase domain-containing protein [Pseudomonadota bacterium]